MLNFQTKIEKTAKSINEAKELILTEFGLSEEEVEMSVLEEGTKGFLGIGSKDAVVIGTVKDAPSYRAKRFLNKIFADMNLEVDIDTKLDGDNLLVNLSGKNMGIIIGKRGDTLDSLQYLTSLVVNKDKENYVKVTLDTENYREKRYAALEALSQRIASKVAKSGRKYTLEPMNPYERRIIHSCLQDHPDVTTFSVGEDPYRKVVISPKNPVRSSYYKKSSYYNNTSAHTPREKKHSSYESYAQSNSEETVEE